MTSSLAYASRSHVVRFSGPSSCVTECGIIVAAAGARPGTVLDRPGAVWPQPRCSVCAAFAPDVRSAVGAVPPAVDAPPPLQVSRPRPALASQGQGAPAGRTDGGTAVGGPAGRPEGGPPFPAGPVARVVSLLDARPRGRRGPGPSNSRSRVTADTALPVNHLGPQHG